MRIIRLCRFNGILTHLLPSTLTQISVNKDLTFRVLRYEGTSKQNFGLIHVTGRKVGQPF